MALSCSPASTIILSDNDMQNAANGPTVIVTDSDSNMQDTVLAIDKIQDRTKAVTNQQAFDAETDVACVRHVCTEVSRILNLSEDEYYSPSNGLIQLVLH